MTDAPTPEPLTRVGSKAGRNEARKLAATFINNVGVGFFLAGVLQPLLALARSEQAFTTTVAISAFLFGAAGLILAFLAQAIAKRLED